MTNVRYPGILKGKARQNFESPNNHFAKALFFEATAAGARNKIIGTVPRNCIIVEPIFIHITEAFDGDNIWIKIGTALNIVSIGKVIVHNAGIFNLWPSGFSTVPSDYGVIFVTDKILTLSIVAESPSSNRVVTRGSMFGILHYIDLNQVEGF